jgi:hypothetical protein
MMRRQRSTSAVCSSSDNQFLNHTAPGATVTASRARAVVNRLDTDSLSCQDSRVVREAQQYYFKCSSCRWFGPLTEQELAGMRVNELGSSRCPRCGQAGYLDPAMPSRHAPLMTWAAVGGVAVIVALVAWLT